MIGFCTWTRTEQYCRYAHRSLSLVAEANPDQSMDELFLLPPGPVAMPRAYWLESKPFTTGLFLIEPSTFAFDQVMDEVSMANPGTFDMEIMNYLYGDRARVIPHRPYLLLTGELRATVHEAYLGTAYESWDVGAILRETKYLHFSDWPVPKVCFRPSVFQLSAADLHSRGLQCGRK